MASGSLLVRTSVERASGPMLQWRTRLVAAACAEFEGVAPFLRGRCGRFFSIHVGFIREGTMIFQRLRRHPTLLSVLLSVLVSAVTVAVADVYFGWKADARYAAYLPRRVASHQEPHPTHPDPELGYVLKRNIVSHDICREGDRLVYDCRYTFDEFGRRHTPVEDKEGRDSFLVFLGCSFTFGLGVNDDQTLPACMGREAPQYVPYNYGVGGYGPQQAYLLQDRIDWEKEVPEPNGIFVYTLIEDHVNRAVGAMHLVNSWAANHPMLRFDDSGRLVNMGRFDKAHPLLARVYRILAKSGIVRYFNVSFPRRFREKHFDLTAHIIAETRRKCLTRYPDSRFVVVLYPTARFRDQLKAHLARYDVECIDLRELLESDGASPAKYGHLFSDFPRPRVYADGHPKPRLHAVCAKVLAAELGIAASDSE